jgi:hypothetical protein
LHGGSAPESPARRIAEAQERLSDLVARWQEVQPTNAIRSTARRLVRVHDVRAPDALQIAAAISAADGRAATMPFVTLDDSLRLAGSREGFQILP